MYARVAKWEGAEAESMRRSAQQIDENRSSGPPEGVPAKGLLVLIDPDGGRGMGITFFETMDDLRQGDAALNKMNPPDDAMGHRTGVEVYEVGADFRL